MMKYSLEAMQYHIKAIYNESVESGELSERFYAVSSIYYKNLNLSYMQAYNESMTDTNLSDRSALETFFLQSGLVDVEKIESTS